MKLHRGARQETAPADEVSRQEEADRALDEATAPFRGEIERILADWRTLNPPSWGDGMGMTANRRQQETLRRFLREYAAGHGEMPTGKRDLTWRCMSFEPRKMTVDFDSLHDQARARQNGTRRPAQASAPGPMA
ncbi:MAG: hypothetical protein FIA95_00080 [Gemmatimonadetes bacterium]|nr:hypothetical protein [Gemmatimonadota bacterium]